MKTEGLEIILEQHEKWVRGEPTGERADLSEANLRRANLFGAIGNGREIHSLQTDRYPVAYTSDAMQIGCQRHSAADWWAFSDERIRSMDVRALQWWQVWKPILQQISNAAPATPHGGHKA